MPDTDPRTTGPGDAQQQRPEQKQGERRGIRRQPEQLRMEGVSRSVQQTMPESQIPGLREPAEQAEGEAEPDQRRAIQTSAPPTTPAISARRRSP